MLFEVAQIKRVAHYNLLLCSLKNEATVCLRFFFGEKIFTVDIKVDRRNDR